ncbi:hypothetical protein E2562_021563 [Oryza meyeriana var. granulata]|uniref:Uncharacterized protein n=1 Tax=Oryza meyeriana var. granulata TaxID=110450 RepID=A0A6G1EY15_9ORYZ|nr:hypothetical protein E2562_034506 [Oryza meyeriana var. granulata]KAF0929462.1 hypothetical protein E2562_021563 [Oryza meyeriana var. granulata]
MKPLGQPATDCGDKQVEEGEDLPSSAATVPRRGHRNGMTASAPGTAMTNAGDVESEKRQERRG